VCRRILFIFKRTLVVSKIEPCNLSQGVNKKILNKCLYTIFMSVFEFYIPDFQFFQFSKSEYVYLM